MRALDVAVFLVASALAALAPAQTIEGKPPAVPFRAEVPLGLPSPLPAPADNPLTAERFALGQRLFFDPRLSADNAVSCATCHPPAHGFASQEPLPPGVHGRRARRHAPSLLNRAWGEFQLWDGRAQSLEQQVLLPIADPDEMGLALDAAVARIAADVDYAGAFRAAYDGDVDTHNLARALASFVRGLTLGGSAPDRFLHGETTAMSKEERAGMWIWESKGACWRCHPRPLFTDEAFHNTGVGAHAGEPEPGRAAITHDPADRGRFKTPTLRGLAATAPYMHDGSLPTLEAVVAFYRRGGNPNSDLSPRLQPLDLTDDDAAALVAFLRSLSRTE